MFSFLYAMHYKLCTIHFCFRMFDVCQTKLQSGPTKRKLSFLIRPLHAAIQMYGHI